MLHSPPAEERYKEYVTMKSKSKVQGYRQTIPQKLWVGTEALLVTWPPMDESLEFGGLVITILDVLSTGNLVYSDNVHLATFDFRLCRHTHHTVSNTQLCKCGALILF